MYNVVAQGEALIITVNGNSCERTVGMWILLAASPLPTVGLTLKG